MQKKTAKTAVARTRTTIRRIEGPSAQKALRKAMGDFDKIEVAEPAVKPERGETRVIKRAVRAFYGRDALART